jgi:hypothetical protein
MGNSYTQKTLKALRDSGAVTGIVEHWNPFDHKRHDLFGFIDIIAMFIPKGGEDGAVCAVQSTGPSGHMDHKRKILAEPRALIWLKSGGTIQLWSWRKLLVKRGGKARRWVQRVEHITEDMFDGED